jgi:hypothetical protein
MRTGRILGAMLLTGAALVVAPAGASAENPHVAHPNNTYCKRVTAREISVFTSASGSGVVAYWTTGTTYLVDRTDPPYNRYHVYGQNEWTTSDPSYVQPC